MSTATPSAVAPASAPLALGIDLSGPLAAAVVLPISSTGDLPLADLPGPATLAPLAQIVQPPHDRPPAERELVDALGSVAAALAAGDVVVPSAPAVAPAVGAGDVLTHLLQRLLSGLGDLGTTRDAAPPRLLRVVLAVPAWLSYGGRDAVQQAACAAGLPAVEVADSPVALLAAHKASATPPPIVVDLGPTETTLALVEPAPVPPWPYRVKDVLRLDSALFPPSPVATRAGASDVRSDAVAPSALVTLHEALLDLSPAPEATPLWIIGPQAGRLVTALATAWPRPIRIVPDRNRAAALGAARLAATLPPALMPPPPIPSPIWRGFGIDLSVGTPRLAALVGPRSVPSVRPFGPESSHAFESLLPTDPAADQICLAADAGAPETRTIVCGLGAAAAATAPRNHTWRIHHPTTYLGLDTLPVGDGTPARLNGAANTIRPVAPVAAFLRWLLTHASVGLPTDNPPLTPVWVRPLLADPRWADALANACQLAGATNSRIIEAEPALLFALLQHGSLGSVHVGHHLLIAQTSELSLQATSLRLTAFTEGRITAEVLGAIAAGTDVLPAQRSRALRSLIAAAGHPDAALVLADPASWATLGGDTLLGGVPRVPLPSVLSPTHLAAAGAALWSAAVASSTRPPIEVAVPALLPHDVGLVVGPPGQTTFFPLWPAGLVIARLPNITRRLTVGAAGDCTVQLAARRLDRPFERGSERLDHLIALPAGDRQLGERMEITLSPGEDLHRAYLDVRAGPHRIGPAPFDLPKP